MQKYKKLLFVLPLMALCCIFMPKEAKAYMDPCTVWYGNGGTCECTGEYTVLSSIGQDPSWRRGCENNDKYIYDGVYESYYFEDGAASTYWLSFSMSGGKGYPCYINLDNPSASCKGNTWVSWGESGHLNNSGTWCYWYKEHCTTCGATIEVWVGHTYPDTWTRYSSTYHKHICTECGYAGSVEYDEHKYGSWSSWTDTGKGTHTRYRCCTLCTDKQTETYSHSFPSTWTYYSATQHKHACTVCSSVEYANHTYAYVDNGNGTTHKKYCSVCDTSKAHATNEAHTYTAWTYDSTNARYYRTCTACKHTQYKTVGISVSLDNSWTPETVTVTGSYTSTAHCGSGVGLSSQVITCYNVNTKTTTTVSTIKTYTASTEEGKFRYTYAWTDKTNNTISATKGSSYTVLIDHSAPIIDPSSYND